MQQKRIVGLDSIRAVCAFWVVMAHLGSPPLTDGLDNSNVIARVFGAVYNNLWSGPAAVIVFFVISGFCINYPYVSTLQIPSISAYMLRRYLRVGIPLVVAVGVSLLLSLDVLAFNDSILWSLVAEIIYYSVFPVLLIFRRRLLTWMQMIIVSFAFGIFLASTNPTAGNYQSFGNALNWILGLPCWLGGCWLAEFVFRSRGSELVTRWSVWSCRLLILTFATVCSVLRFHSPIGYPWTLNVFGFFVMFWLAKEIRWCSVHPPSKWLEWVGSWSYSVYLFHVLAVSFYLWFEKPNFGPFFNWAFMIAFVMIACYLFYCLVEYPGHVFARYAGRAVVFSRRSLFKNESQPHGDSNSNGVRL